MMRRRGSNSTKDGNHRRSLSRPPKAHLDGGQRPDLAQVLPFLEERVVLSIPSDLRYLDGVLDYFSDRLHHLGLVDGQDSEVLIALDEAIVNAIKHGNKSDARKSVHIVAELRADQACFTITDEGSGFSWEKVPDPTDPARLLEPSGRGLLLMNHIMDEVCYNKSGNEVRMVKRCASEIASPCCNNNNRKKK